MQTSMRTSQRGASYWPFIISLVLLLVVTFLWFDRKSDGEKIQGERDAALAKIEVLVKQVGDWDEYATKLSNVVGFPAASKIPGVSKSLADVDAITAAISLESPTSVFGKWKDASTVAVVKAFYKGTTVAPPPAVEVAKISDAFKAKIAEIEAAKPGSPPTLPIDVDDADAKKKYDEDRAAYDEKFKKYDALVSEAVGMKDFALLKPVLGAPGLLGSVSMWSLDKQAEAVKWQFLAQPSVPTMTIEEMLRLPEDVMKKMKSEWTTSVNSLQAQIVALTAEKADRDTTIEKVQAELAAAQTDRTTDNGKLSKEAQDAKDALEKARIELTNATNLLAQAGDKAKIDAASAKQQINALRDAVQSNKEVLGDAIERDVKDGEILDANNAQAVTYINLGTADKVFAGLKFSVWNSGRGAFRVTKGEIVVTRVIDPHYSQARIASSTAPLSRRDSISNPLFSSDRPIRLFLAGDLQKYPKAIAIERLKRMNVIVEDTINTHTDYVLVPSGMSVSAGGEKPAEGAAAPAAESEFDKLTRMARAVGANLITEKMIEAFLDY